MRIYGTNRPNLNPYVEQQQKVKQSQRKQSKDRLEISETAKQLQNHGQVKTQRQAYVDHIKNQIDTGEYQINYEQTAKKMLDFFTK